MANERTDRIRTRPALWLASAVAAAAAGAWAIGPVGDVVRAQGDADGSASGSRAEVHALGRVEPSGGLITVGSRPGARILEIRVKPGDEVKAGQLLAVLEGNDQAKAQLALAEAQKAKVEHERATRKEKLQIERKQVDALHAARLAAATQIDQILKKKLLDPSNLGLGATLEGRDKVDAESKYIELQVQSQKSGLDKKSLEIEADGLKEQRALEDKLLEPTNPDFQLADRQVDLAKAGLAQTEIVAPAAGTILDVLAHAGEVGSGPLLQMGDLSAMVVKAEVYQTDVGRIHAGDRATVSILDKNVGGKVSRVGSVVGRNQMMSLDPRALQDLRVVSVTIALDEAEPAARLINYEAEVAITPGGGG
jgi:HlyD family secretion protein